MSERRNPDTVLQKPTGSQLEDFSAYVAVIEQTSPTELGTLVKRFTKEALVAQKKPKIARRWRNLKDRALARAMDLKASGSERILIGKGFAENKEREQEERLYFVFLGNETNPSYVTGVPTKFTPKIENYRRNKGYLDLNEDISEYISKVHKKRN